MVSLGYKGEWISKKPTNQHEIVIVYHVMFNQSCVAVSTEQDSYLQKIRFLYPFAVNVRSSFLY